jgi:hypothetical protein
MAMAENDSTTPFEPSGYRALIGVVIEYGVDRVRRWLADQRIEALGINPKTGRRYEVYIDLWLSEEAVEVLRTGKYRNLVIFVRDFDWPPDHVFLPPDEREGFPPPSPEPVEPAVAPEPAEPIEPEPEPAELPERGEPATPDLPTPEAEPARHPGGKEPDHDWEKAACYVDSKTVDVKKLLPRNKHGNPIVQRAIDFMREYFKDNEPPPPKDRSIRRWITDNPTLTQKWWDAE